MEYPIKKYDRLNRLIYIDKNGIERVVNIYWDDTNKLKIKYRLWYNETEVEAYDKNGNIIIKSNSSEIVIKFPKFKFEKGEFVYYIEKNKVKEWIKKLDCNKY